MKRILALLFALFIMIPLALRSEEFQPQSVWTSASTAENQGVERMIDGDYNTETCLNDDSLTPQGKPSTPVTATLVLDLGEKKATRGVRLVAPKSWAYRSPLCVSVWTCSDAQGASRLRPLCRYVDLPPVASSGSGFLTWEPIACRFLCIEIHDSWNRDHTPGFRSESIQYNVKDSDFRYRAFPNTGWWDGIFKADVQRYNYDKDYAGDGRTFDTRIAEIFVFDVLPDDFTRPNRADEAFPVDRLRKDWILQDHGYDWRAAFASKDSSVVERAMVEKVYKETGADLKALDALNDLPGSDPKWRQAYFSACEVRRQKRLAFVRNQVRQIVYVKSCFLGDWTGASVDSYHSDGEHDMHNPDFRLGAQLCMITLQDDGTVKNEVLVDKPDGMILDPGFSFDAKTLVFSMRNDFVHDDFYLYTMEFNDDGTVSPPRQITFPLTAPDGRKIPVADTTPVFTAEGNIAFLSTRCGQQIDCWIVPAANMYICDRNGQGIRRLGFDQLSTFDPCVMNDGRILFTRWEYNDRTHGFMQALFTMNSDGTAQQEFYGNNSWYPNTLAQSCAIPGSDKVLTLSTGHHCNHKGKLIFVDRNKGTQGDSGITYIAGSHPDGTPGVKESGFMVNRPWRLDMRWEMDAFGQTGAQWQYPFAFNENNYLVTFLPEGCQYQKGPLNPQFGIYYQTIDGKRELLAYDPTISSRRSAPRMVRPVPHSRGSLVDPEQSFGQYYVRDIYYGPGLKDVPRGTIKTLRVIGLEYRPGRIGFNYNRGIGGDTPVQMPVAVGGGSYDVKHVLGEAVIEDDGSCLFEVPANTPVYFQMIDDRGRCVQTMRSWSTLMPGETFACVGCHEDKREVVSTTSRTIAMSKPAQKLRPVAGMTHPLLQRLETQGRLATIENFMNINQIRAVDSPAVIEGFSYLNRVQPIWDKHCISCHPGEKSKLDLTARVIPTSTEKRVGIASYHDLVIDSMNISSPEEIAAYEQKTGQKPLTCWYHAQGPATMLPPYAAGSTRSRLMDYLETSHYNVQLTPEEKTIVACWIDLSVPKEGAYYESNQWTKEDVDWYNYCQLRRLLSAQDEWETAKKRQP